MGSINLTDHFLIAMPAMEDLFFARSLIYIAEHNDQGALGIIVNRPTDMSLSSLLEKINANIETSETVDLSACPVLFGGPVQTDRGFVLHRPLGRWQATLVVNDDVGLTSSRDVLQAFAREGKPHEMMLTLGYSGWGAGQLECEISQNAWLTVPADQRILFETPFEEKLPSAMERLGIDFANFSGKAGHA
ncbi:MAG: YqgE/AlgH family protein [Candidatus Accumulibacter sp.]|jgi:putative transcriptional regulator|nr:YqgE/AlgH family protein [Accumulibacter sp.]